MTFRYSLVSLMLLGLAGCATTGEADFATQANSSQNIAIQQLIERVEQTPPVLGSQQAPNRITDLINVPELEQYLSAAFANNPNLQQSIVALKIAYAQEGISFADQLPTVSAGFSGEKTEGSNESYNADLTVSWELDVWQRLSDVTAASQKDVAANQANLQNATNLLAANIMRGWLEISVNQQLLDIEQRRLAILEINETLVLERYQVGLGTLEELDNAKTNTASTRATVAQYQENLAQSKRSLLLLTGELNAPVTDIQVAADFPQILNPLNSMSVQDLSGRPDLQQAFFNIEAESLRTDAAYKAMLPSFSLSASLKDMAETPSEALFANPLWTALGQISAPLFQGGKLKANAEIAELTTEQSYWAYQETLLTAVNEVENAIGQESALAQQQQHLSTSLTSAKRSVVSYEEKYRQGLVDIFDLLTVQRQAYDVEAQLTNTTYQRLLNRIDLGLALGLGVNA
ncbi:TolC family protein [Photobacterium rosenbergii]|uniref:TolC family protein n=1 Tax=Photobacterium rosenbergii TaxID=294936 RepID=UPI001C99091A|nr:TolC family protein [Photobacterium rosenbergii]MBY5948354.1 TolC family protein [Photobacterium rosenbergii]